MKRTLSAMMMACLLASVAAGREWNSREGNFKVDAELLDVKEGNVVLKCTDGRQLTVPVSKLSLGDIRYVNQMLKEAEASLSGGSSTTPAPFEKSSPAPAPATPSKAAISSAERSRLTYDWKAGKTYVYRMKVSADRGDYAEEYSGDVTYKAATSKDEGFVLAVTGELNRGEKSLPDARVIRVGRHFVHLDSAKKPTKSITLAVNSRGRVSRMDGSSPLPYLLGDLSQLVVEPLGSATEDSWTVSNYTGITVISSSFPYHRFLVGSLSRRGRGQREGGVQDRKLPGQADHDCQALRTGQRDRIRRQATVRSDRRRNAEVRHRARSVRQHGFRDAGRRPTEEQDRRDSLEGHVSAPGRRRGCPKSPRPKRRRRRKRNARSALRRSTRRSPT